MQGGLVAAAHTLPCLSVSERAAKAGMRVRLHSASSTVPPAINWERRSRTLCFSPTNGVAFPVSSLLWELVKTAAGKMRNGSVACCWKNHFGSRVLAWLVLIRNAYTRTKGGLGGSAAHLHLASLSIIDVRQGSSQWVVKKCTMREGNGRVLSCSP